MPIPDGADKEKLAEVALAILWLGAHGDKTATRVWKGVDWQVTDILYEKGWISDPQGKAKSVMLSEEGEKLAQELFEKHFSKKKQARRSPISNATGGGVLLEENFSGSLKAEAGARPFVK